MLDRRRFLTQAAAATTAACTGASVTGRCHGAEPRAPVVIDTHTHFYDPTRPGGVPWPGRQDAMLYRPVLPVEWERLVQPLGVTGTVVVEASPLVEDNQWLLDLADRHSRERLPGMLGIVGVVGSLPLGDPACGGWIERFAKHPLYRGIRVHGDRLIAGLDDAAYAADLARLADHDLALDINGGRVFAAATAVAPRLPQLRIIIDHMGNTPLSEAGPLSAWREAIATAARNPNVFMKVSALAENTARQLGSAGAALSSSFYEPWLDAAWAAFGERRLMFGSNWPVSTRAATYADVLRIVTPAVTRRGAEAERWFYAETARAAYRWVEPPT